MLLNTKCFDFLYNFSETFLILRRNERDIIKNVRWSQSKLPVNLSDFNKLASSRRNFGKYSNTEIYLNPSSESRVVARRTDRNDETDFIFSQLCESAKNDVI
jgi:hypothetical protein